MASTLEPTQSTNGHAATIEVTNPATGEIVAHVPKLDDAQVVALVERARAAQPAWAAMGFKQRAALMLDLRAWIVKHRKQVAEALMAEAGKTFEDGLVEVTYVCEALGFWAKNAPKYLGETKLRPLSPVLIGRKVITRYEPRGVVGVIAPWNYPVVLGFGDVIPALMAGNAVVVKPSGITPLSTLVLVNEGMKAVGFPADVCLVATGRGAVGSVLVDHCDMIMFTGSTETGKMIAARAAKKLTPVALELGGKDPMIVLADADLDRAADVAVAGGLMNAGQTCMSVERIYVEGPAHDELVRKITERVEKLRTGVAGNTPSIDIGSMTGSGQIDIVERHVNDAVAKGARVVTGGKRRPGAGDFFEPTVLVDVDHTMECMTEETFGPTLPIMRVSDAEEALRLSNDSPYGLNSSVFTKDLARGEALARRIEAGSACVNDALLNYFELRAPFAGWKDSGVGGRHGAGGIQKYCKAQTVMVTRFAAKPDPMQYPRTKAKRKMLEMTLVLLYGRGSKRR